MELHESLYALGQAQGRALFDDPDGFRGALDDYLDEDAASTGDINLLVDAVRLGAFSSMLTMLDSGADPGRAVQEAGTRLARDRGSSDVGSAQWALAVLGYAVGKVSDAQVRQYRTQHFSAPPATGAVTAPPPTAVPPRPAPPVAPTSFTGQQPGAPAQSGQAPAQPYGAPGSQPPPPSQPGGYAQPGGYSQPGGWSQGAAGASSWPPGQAPKKKSKAVPIAIAVVIVLIVAGGGIGLAVALGGGSGGGGGGGGGGGDDTVSLEPAAIDERYAGLGSSVTSGTSGCEEADAAAGETEHLTCTFAGGTLDLVTYESAEQVESARARVLTNNIGARSQVEDTTAFYSYDPESAVDPTGDPAKVYWDTADDMLSATLTADDAKAKLEPLVNTFKGTSPTVEEPTAPSDPDMVDFGDDFLKMGKCERIANLADGEVEENLCAAPQGISVYLAKFDSVGDFRSYRAGRRQNAVDSGVSDYTKWEFQDSGVAREGALYLYVDTNGSAVIYWDQPDCLCYAQGYLGSGDYDALYAWWQQA